VVRHVVVEGWRMAMWERGVEWVWGRRSGGGLFREVQLACMCSLGSGDFRATQPRQKGKPHRNSISSLSPCFQRTQYKHLKAPVFFSL
jgi:hypothetical protein